MRGKQAAPIRTTTSSRIIPAHAGQTRGSSSNSSRTKDHPRACGANASNAFFAASAAGSSPRMRGKPLIRADKVMGIRIIPAHAGQTVCVAHANAVEADHPRACGANEAWDGTSAPPDGSSPRMRGKRTHRIRHQCGDRIIPAHAGQTVLARHWVASLTDHPRACGANGARQRVVRVDDGSSPRMRGKPGRWAGCRPASRIIPAHAGQTSGISSAAYSRPDHPRACGANILPAATAGTACGSSPRMRGKRRADALRRGRARIIPAHAGQTI